MLAGTCFGQEAGLAHPLGQERLAQHVVDLVGSRVVEVLTLEQQTATQFGRKVMALRHGRGPTGVVRQEGVQGGSERRIGPRIAEGRF